MKKATKFVVATVVIGTIGVGASLFLIPEEQNLQQMQVRDDALRSATFIDYAELYASGKRTPDVVIGYADQLVSMDQAAAAVPVLEEHLAITPTDAAARRKLAEVHQLSGNNEAYLESLRWLADNADDEDSLRLLSDYYNGIGDLSSQENVLQRLLVVTEGNDPKIFVDLATIQASLGDRGAASETLGKLAERHPNHMDFSTMRLYVLALLDKGDVGRAEQYAGRWIAADFKPLEAADFANILHYQASPQSSLGLLKPYENVVTSHDSLLHSYVNALSSSGEKRRAYELLRQHAAVAPLSSTILISYLPLAFEFAGREEIVRIINAIIPSDYSEDAAIELVRLAKQQDDTELAELVVSRFNDPAILETRPVLAAVLALDGEDQALADDRVEVALAKPISSNLRIALANACADAGNEACVQALLDTLPPVEKMSPSMVANATTLYMSLDRSDEIYPEVTTYRTENPSALLDQTWLRLAAATGDKATMQAWLDANAESASTSTLKEFYFTATNNGHFQTASAIAEALFKRADTADNRSLMVNAYLRSYQYGKALPHLRDMRGESARAEADYVTTLERLSRNSSSARKELVDYAKDKLARGGISQSEQRRFVFLLINNGHKDAARNIIQANANRYGGQWQTMLDQIDGSGGEATDPVRVMAPDERLQYALQPDIPRERKREIAFGLIEDGYENQALSIFNELAARQGPGSEDVSDILFLLEKRSPQASLNWMDQRRRAATSNEERLAWSQLIADKSDPYAFMSLISSDPSLLSQPNLRDRYFFELANHGSREEYENAMRPWVSATTDINGLIEYAKIADQKGYREAAMTAYKRAYSLDNSNPKALHDLGVNAFLQADYSEASKYLDRYFSTRSRGVTPSDNPYLAAYYKAEMLRRGGDMASAQGYFQQAFEAARVLPDQSVGSQSIMYSSLFHLGKSQQAIQGFRTLLQRFPKDRNLLADYMTVLIEYKYYEEAQRVANQYDYSPRLQSPAQVGRPLSSNEDFELHYEFTPASEQVGNYRPTDETLRLQLLYARIEQENGDRDAALNRLNIMRQYYPNNPELNGYIAGIESASGNYNRALQLLNQAHSLTPQNEDIARLKKDIRKVHGSYAKIDHEWRRIGNSDERITTLAGRGMVDSSTAVGLILQNNEIDTSQVRRSSDGVIDDDEYTKNRGELYLDSYTDEGSRHRFSLLGNSATLGAGYAYAFNNSVGRTDLILDFRRPYWDFVEAAVEDASRDRIGLTHTSQLSDTISFFGETSINRYNIQDETDAASSYLLRLSFVKKIRDAQPYFGLGYGFDGEYMFDKDRRRDVNGNIYATFPITAREIHFLSAIFQHAFTQTLTGDLVAGYAIDRLGGHGPAVEAKLTQELTDSLEAQARFRYGLETNETDNNASTVGGHLLWRY